MKTRLDSHHPSGSPPALEDRFREAKLPLTIQRRAVYKAVIEDPSHPTADQIHAAVRETHPEFHKTTVYRALETLVRVGLLHRVAHPGAAVRYDANIDRHHHFTCLGCGRMIDVTASAKDSVSVPDLVQGFTVVGHSVHFKGWCPDCDRESESTHNQPRDHESQT